MAYETILYEERGEVALITLNRPQRLNAWTPHMGAEQADAIERANGNRAIGAIVMTGAGRGFCAGADMPKRSRRGSAAKIRGPTPPAARAECPQTSTG